MKDALKIFSGNANPDLTQKIADYIGVEVGKAEVTQFSEGEIFVKIQENVRGRDVFVVQPTCPPSNDSFMELLIMIDALRRASASRITAVIPYYGYARQDRKDQPRVPITAKLVANLITAAGTDRVLCLDLHTDQIQGFFDIPVDNLYAATVFADEFKSMGLKDVTVVSPDVGGIKSARAFAKRLGADLAVVDKRRVNSEQAEVMNIMGDVEGRNIVIVDDIISTAGSVTEAAQALKNRGAKDIYCCISHPVLVGPALERIGKSPIKTLNVTDSIPIGDKVQEKRIQVLTVAKLLGEAIMRIHKNESVSSLFA
ncbi:MAG: ribose-phosphate pyrophosphokinase [Candidatus Ancaeobacter aquaticus]|nr:ribose-phosphate pyrophosphokinase [Candidatus Ancaeobacter aquaticus]